MQMNVDTSDSCVNTLIVANFNLLSRAIQEDTQRFELIERFIKVRNLLWCAFSLHLDPTFEIFSLKPG